MAAFWGMHVSPAKHRCVWLPRKCDYRTDRQTDGRTDARQSDPYMPLCFAGDTIISISSLFLCKGSFAYFYQCTFTIICSDLINAESLIAYYHISSKELYSCESVYLDIMFYNASSREVYPLQPDFEFDLDLTYVIIIPTTFPSLSF